MLYLFFAGMLFCKSINQPCMLSQVLNTLPKSETSAQLDLFLIGFFVYAARNNNILTTLSLFSLSFIIAW